MDFKTRYQYNPKNDLLGKGGMVLNTKEIFMTIVN